MDDDRIQQSWLGNARKLGLPPDGDLWWLARTCYFGGAAALLEMLLRARGRAAVGALMESVKRELLRAGPLVAREED